MFELAYATHNWHKLLNEANQRRKSDAHTPLLSSQSVKETDSIS